MHGSRAPITNIDWGGMATTIDVAAVIDRQKLGRFQIVTFALCTVFLFLDGFDSQVIGYLAPALVRDWHINRVALGPLFSAGALGIALGAIGMGMLSDWLGRRRALLICVSCFSLLTFATGFTRAIEPMMALRLLSGLALGGGMPIAYALVSEYFPRRIRATVIMLCGLGFAIGAGSAGFITAFFLPRWGWQSLFWLGGAVPFLLMAASTRYLPESIRYLVVTKAPREKIVQLFLRLDPRQQVGDDAIFIVTEETRGGLPVARLFTEGRAAYTLLLWLSVFTNLLVLYFIVTWLPTLFTARGFSITAAATTVGMFGVGGPIGVALLGFVIDRYGAPLVLGFGFIVAGMAMAALSSVLDSSVAVSIALMVIGFFVSGGNGGTSAYAGGVYPTALRSTGMGWALGIGRTGAFVAPLIAAAMVADQWTLPSILRTFAASEFVAAMAILLTLKVLPRRVADTQPAQ